MKIDIKTQTVSGQPGFGLKNATIIGLEGKANMKVKVSNLPDLYRNLVIQLTYYSEHAIHK